MSVKAMTRSDLLCLISTADMLRFRVETALRAEGLECRLCYTVDADWDMLMLRISGTHDSAENQYAVRLEDLETLAQCRYSVLETVADGIAVTILGHIGVAAVDSPLFAPCDTCQESRRVGNKPCPDCTETVT